MKTKIEIKSYLGKLLFEFEKENNSIKDTLIEAVKKSADLRDADLRGADLRDADLNYADLSCADLRGADLRGADLNCADLRDADLSCADLRDVDLRGADLRDADLRGADLRGADLSGADLSGAEGKELNDIKKYFWIIPEEGSFIAWKKCRDAIVKIEIPANAKRTSNLLNRKCRAEFVKVIEIKNTEGKKIEKAFGLCDSKLLYEVGNITKADSFDDDFTIDCSHGIHFFLTRKEAEEWNV